MEDRIASGTEILLLSIQRHENRCNNVNLFANAFDAIINIYINEFIQEIVSFAGPLAKENINSSRGLNLQDELWQ